MPARPRPKGQLPERSHLRRARLSWRPPRADQGPGPGGVQPDWAAGRQAQHRNRDCSPQRQQRYADYCGSNTGLPAWHIHSNIVQHHLLQFSEPYVQSGELVVVAVFRCNGCPDSGGIGGVMSSGEEAESDAVIIPECWIGGDAD